MSNADKLLPYKKAFKKSFDAYSKKCQEQREPTQEELDSFFENAYDAAAESLKNSFPPFAPLSEEQEKQIEFARRCFSQQPHVACMLEVIDQLRTQPKAWMEAVKQAYSFISTPQDCTCETQPGCISCNKAISIQNKLLSIITSAESVKTG